MKSAYGRQTPPPVEQDRDPINVVRDAAAARAIPTNAWNTVLTRGETAVAEADSL